MSKNWFEVDRAWAAGIIDGDGCIAIKMSGKSGFYGVSVIVGQTVHQECILQKLRAMYGGSYSPMRAKAPESVPFSNWQVTAAQAHACLLSVRPYLVGKAAQADIAIEFRQYVVRPGQRNTDIQRRAKADLYQRIHALKHYDKTHHKFQRTHARNLLNLGAQP